MLAMVEGEFMPPDHPHRSKRRPYSRSVRSSRPTSIPKPRSGSSQRTSERAGRKRSLKRLAPLMLTILGAIIDPVSIYAYQQLNDRVLPPARIESNHAVPVAPIKTPASLDNNAHDRGWLRSALRIPNLLVTTRSQVRTFSSWRATPFLIHPCRHQLTESAKLRLGHQRGHKLINRSFSC